MRSRLSVLMSVYRQDSPEHLSQSLQSLQSQTVRADQVVCVKDGPLSPELEAVIAQYTDSLSMICLSLPVNQGLGTALRLGLEACAYDLVARMDADDISVENRFERQIQFMGCHPEVDIVGSSIAEFDTEPTLCIAERRLPITHEQLYSLAKWRCPMNHMTVMYRKKSVLSSGSYRSVIGFEDYDLWVRMLMDGAHFHNLNEILVLARRGNGMLSRRGGIKYARRELSLLLSFHQRGFLTLGQMYTRSIVRILPRLMPTWLRAYFYGLFLRVKH